MDFRDTVKMSVLPNGLTVVTDTLPDNPVLYADIAILSGGSSDPKDKIGISHLGEHMNGYGIPGETLDEFYDKNRLVGFKNFNISTSHNHVSYWSYGELNDVQAYLTEMSQRLTSRSYTQDDLDHEIDRITKEMRANFEKEGHEMHLLSLRAKFGFSQLSQPSGGYPGGFERITLQDIANHHETTMVGQNMALFTSGGWSHDETVAWACENLSHFPEGEKLETPPDDYNVQDIWTEKHGAEATEVKLYFPLFEDGPEDNAVAFILINILNNILSPISKKHGLYGVVAGIEASPSTKNTLVISTSCNPEQVSKVIQDMMSLFEHSEPQIVSQIPSVKANLEKGIKMYNGIELSIPENRYYNLKSNFMLGDILYGLKSNDAVKDATDRDVLNMLRHVLKQKPATFYYGAIIDSMPTGEMIQRRDFSGNTSKPVHRTKFDFTPFS